MQARQKPKKNDIYGVIYRPPEQPVKQFLDTLEEIVNIVNKENKNIYLMGDFNISLLNVNY